MITPEQKQLQENKGMIQVSSSMIENNDIASAALHLEFSKMAGAESGNTEE